MAGANGVIRGLHMDHYVLAEDGEYGHDPQRQCQQQQVRAPSFLEQAQSDEYTEAMMIDNRRKSCARTTVDDVGYLCGCGTSAVDDAEVVYVKRKNVTPRNVNVSDQMNYSDQRGDVSSARYGNGYASGMGEYREEGFEVNMEDLRYALPRVGCVPAGVVDLLMNGACRPQPRHSFNEARPHESQVQSNHSTQNRLEQHDEKKIGYDEWKKQMLDTVKAPSFSTGDADAGVERVGTLRKESNSFAATDPPDYKAVTDTQSSRPSRAPVDNNELNQLRSEQESLRRAREELQSEVEAFKRHNRDIVKTTSHMSHTDGSVDASRRQVDYKEMMVNQRFNEVMSIASPRSNVISAAPNMLNGHDYLTPRPSNSNWNSDIASHIGLSYLPPSPMGGNHKMSSPMSSNDQCFQSYSMPFPMARVNNMSLYQGIDMNSQGPQRSPAAMMEGNNMSFHSGLGESNYGSYDHHMRDDNPSLRFTQYMGRHNENDDLLNEMKMKSAVMEADLMRMKESMSPRFQPSSHGSASVAPQRGNGILRPSSYSYNNVHDRQSQYRGL